MSDLLICPSCGLPITTGNGPCACGVYDSYSGVFDLLKDRDVYWGEISQERMRWVLQAARSKGWRGALVDVVNEFPDLKEYLLSNRRIDWLFHCLRPSGNGTCLDIGSGWGSNTFGLSEYFDEVWSLEAVRERIEFQSIRREQEKRENVRLVRTDWLKLPFADNSFDLVVCNGILEWIGLSDYSRNPRELQVQFLKEVRRVLKNGGCAYVGIENRLGYHSFKGARDHSGLKYTNLMPRIVADLVVRNARNREEGYTRDKRVREDWHSYRTYTYTKWGYRRLLADSGFSEPSIYWTGSYNLPKYSGRIDDDSYPFFLRSMKAAYGPRGSSKDKMLKVMPNRLVRLVQGIFSPSFLIYAYKGQTTPTLEHVILGDDRSGKALVKASGAHGKSSKISFFIADNMRLSRVVKMPRFPTGEESVRLEELRLAEHASLDIKESVVGGMKVYEEPPIDGRTLVPRSREDIRAALHWLTGFQKSAAIDTAVPTEAQRLELERLRDLLKDLPMKGETAQEASRLVSAFEEELGGSGLRACAEHGDFFHDNILRTRDGMIVVTDWEYFSEEGMPLFDPVFFLLSNASKGTDPKGMVECVDGGNPYGMVMVEEIRRYAGDMGIEPGLVVRAFPYVMLRAALRESRDDINGQLRSGYYSELLRLWLSESLEAKMMDRLSAQHRS